MCANGVMTVLPMAIQLLLADLIVKVLAAWHTLSLVPAKLN